MFTGILELDLLLGDVHSLKQKRSLIKPLIADIARKWPVAVAEADYQDLHRRALIGVAVLAGESGHCRRVCEDIEQFVADRPEFDLLSARTRLIGPED